MSGESECRGIWRNSARYLPRRRTSGGAQAALLVLAQSQRVFAERVKVRWGTRRCSLLLLCQVGWTTRGSSCDLASLLAVLLSAGGRRKSPPQAPGQNND